MRSICFPLFIFMFSCFVSGTALAQDTAVKEKQKNADPTGTWRWESERDGNTVKHQLSVKADDKGNVTAVYNGMLDDLKSASGSIKGNKLVVDFEVERPNRSFEAKYTATIKGDKADGTITLSSDEGSMDLPWNATRTVEMSDLVGKWELVIEGPEEDHEPTMTITEKAGKFAAVFEGDEIGTCPVKGLKLEDGVFTFTVTGELQGMDFVAKCKTNATAAKLNGEMMLDIDGESLALPLSGKHLRGPRLADLVGTWNLLLEAPDEDHEPKLIVTEKDGKVTATFDADGAGQFEAKGLRLDGDTLKFAMAGELEGQDFEAVCVGQVNNGTFKGEMLLDLGGEEMELPLSGKLAK